MHVCQVWYWQVHYGRRGGLYSREMHPAGSETQRDEVSLTGFLFGRILVVWSIFSISNNNTALNRLVGATVKIVT